MGNRVSLNLQCELSVERRRLHRIIHFIKLINDKQNSQHFNDEKFPPTRRHRSLKLCHHNERDYANEIITETQQRLG